MATPADIAALRKITDGAKGYTDLELSSLLDAGATEQQLAYRIWNEIAASTAQMVNVSESGSSRNLSDLHKNALTMASIYAPGAVLQAEVTVKRSRRMVRG